MTLVSRTLKHSHRVPARPGRIRFLCSSIMALSVTVCLTGCQMMGMLATAHLVNVTSHDEYWEGFQKDGIYEVQQDVFLLRVHEWHRKKFALAIPSGARIRGREYSAPRTVEDFSNNRSKWPNIVGIIAAGTRIQVQRLYAIDALFLSMQPVEPFGTILDGEFESTKTDIADMCDIIDVDAQPMLCRPDDRLLRLVE